MLGQVVVAICRQQIMAAEGLRYWREYSTVLDRMNICILAVVYTFYPSFRHWPYPSEWRGGEQWFELWCDEYTDRFGMWCHYFNQHVVLHFASSYSALFDRVNTIRL